MLLYASSFIVSVVLIALIDHDFWFGATIVGAAGVVLLHFFAAGWSLWNFAWANPMLLVWYVAGYVMVGICWSVFRWWQFMLDSVERELASKKRWIESNASSKVKSTVCLEYSYSRPEASSNIEKLIGWMTYWPWSGFWFLLNRPFKWLVRQLSGVYDAIGKSVYARMDA